MGGQLQALILGAAILLAFAAPAFPCAPGAAYQLTAVGVTRLSDGAVIPNDRSNSDWLCYQQWLADGNIAAPAPAPSPQQQLAQKIDAGVAVTSTGNPALNATYPIDPAAQSHIQAVSLYIQVTGKFPAGQAIFPWPDVAGTKHSFQTTAQFQAFAAALADYVTAIELGQTPQTPLSIP